MYVRVAELFSYTKRCENSALYLHMFLLVFSTLVSRNVDRCGQTRIYLVRNSWPRNFCIFTFLSDLFLFTFLYFVFYHFVMYFCSVFVFCTFIVLSCFFHFCVLYFYHIILCVLVHFPCFVLLSFYLMYFCPSDYSFLRFVLVISIDMC